MGKILLREEQQFVTTFLTSKTHMLQTDKSLLFPSMENKHVSFYSFLGIVAFKVTNE